MFRRINSFMMWLGGTGHGNFFLAIVVILAIGLPPVIASITSGIFQLSAFSGLAATACVSMMLMTINCGSPKNWWTPFFGIEMVVNLSKITQMNDSTIRKEISDWVEIMSSGPYIKINDFKYKFLRKRDAVAFKLAWM